MAATAGRKAVATQGPDRPVRKEGSDDATKGSFLVLTLVSRTCIVLSPSCFHRAIFQLATWPSDGMRTLVVAFTPETQTPGDSQRLKACARNVQLRQTQRGEVQGSRLQKKRDRDQVEGLTVK